MVCSTQPSGKSSFPWKPLRKRTGAFKKNTWQAIGQPSVHHSPPNKSEEMFSIEKSKAFSSVLRSSFNFKKSLHFRCKWCYSSYAHLLRSPQLLHLNHNCSIKQTITGYWLCETVWFVHKHIVYTSLRKLHLNISVNTFFLSELSVFVAKNTSGTLIALFLVSTMSQYPSTWLLFAPLCSAASHKWQCVCCLGLSR